MVASATTDVTQWVGGRAALQQQIEALGIPTLPWESVNEHKKKVMREYRYGVRKFIGPLFVGMLYLFGLFTIHADTQRVVWARYRADKLPPGIVWLSLTFAVIFPALAAWATHISWWYLFIASTPLLAGFCKLLLQEVILSCTMLEEATSRWLTVRVTADGENVNVTHMPDMPARLRQRAKLATQVPGVRTFVDLFYKDPFLVAECGTWPFIDRVVIGAWNTGDKKLDNV